MRTNFHFRGFSQGWRRTAPQQGLRDVGGVFRMVKTLQLIRDESRSLQFISYNYRQDFQLDWRNFMQCKNSSQIQLLISLIFLTLSQLSILQKNPRFFLASACLLNFLLNSFPKKIFQISSPSPCDNLIKKRLFSVKF